MTALPEGLTQGTWTLDASHTTVAFTVRHAGISKTRGQFTDVSGRMIIGEKLEDSRINAEIQIASLTTGNEDRDNHLKSADFFDAEQFTAMAFTSTAFDGTTLKGDLSIKDVTKEVELDVDYEGAATDPFGSYRAGFSATTKISRKEFGLTWNAALEAGGVLVGDTVTITIDVEFTAPAAA